MPKSELQHHAGHPLNKELKELLSKLFSDKELMRFERLGGRIMISLTSPYHSKKSSQKHLIEIDQEFIDNLMTLKNKPDELKEQLNSLSKKQLIKLGIIAEHPFRTKSPKQEIIEELYSFFHSEEVWNRISGYSKLGSGRRSKA